MEISFLGAAKEVGRSAMLLDTTKSKVVCDYGIKLGDRTEYPLPVHGYLDAVILSHAHLDHSGAIPMLFQSAEPNVYCPYGTAPLIELLLQDSIKISRIRKESTYTTTHLKRMMRNTESVYYNEAKKVTSEISFEYSDAGHILGAGITKIHANSGKGIDIVYSGDFKDTGTHLHAGCKMPGKADALVIEATYGDAEHSDREALEKEFISNVRQVIESGGTVLVPAFAVGRSQEIVSMLYKHKIPCPVYLDGMARAASEIYLEFSKQVRDFEELYQAMKWVNWISDQRQRREVFNEPSVIVSTAGMLTGGPAMYYLLELKDIGNSAVFFTGYQVDGTPGRRLLENGKFEVNDLDIDLSGLRIKHFDFSAHCDKTGLQKMIKSVDPSVLFVNHGEEEPCNALKGWAEDEIGCYAFAPSLRDKYKLEDYL